jgi:hypothetical protein
LRQRPEVVAERQDLGQPAEGASAWVHWSTMRLITGGSVSSLVTRSDSVVQEVDFGGFDGLRVLD